MKAIALFSGGLDSMLSAKIMQDLGIEVIALNFASVFFARNPAQRYADILGIKLHVIDFTKEHLEMVKKPRFGLGKNMNPCIDCKIFMLTQARKLMDELGASFVVTGEVLGERPMSQRRDALRLIEKNSGLEGLVLRPLSAKLLPPTIPEKEGWVERERLYAIRGRSRRMQLELAQQFGIEEFATPAGGCLLTDPGFSKRLKDLLDHTEPDILDLKLLKYGRHLRLSDSCKLVVGRNESENERLESLVKGKAPVLRLEDFPGPIAVLCGDADETILRTACALVARYSKARDLPSVKVAFYSPSGQKQTIEVSPIRAEEAESYII